MNNNNSINFDFSHYYTYQEIINFLKEKSSQYPNLISLEVIGQSYGGKEIWLATLTNKNTGKPLDKPGYWVDANTHAGEVTGSAVALYIINYFLSQYQQDKKVTRILDNYTVYVLPRLAVDGAEKYLTTSYSLRSSIRNYPNPEPEDGLYLEDINDDGLILKMRLKDDCGAWKISEQDPRIMIPRQPDEFGGTYYNLLPEGLIRNYDGYNLKIAPTLEGLDFNRNYPQEWQPESQEKGAGDYPFSEPETRAEAEFWRTHRNINGFVSYHTFSAVFLRPYSNHPDDYFPFEDLEIYKLIGKKATEITGYECINAYDNFRYHPKDLTSGVMDNYGYDQMGWYGFTVELWDAPTEAGVEKQDYLQWFKEHPESDDLKLLKWNDEKLDGKGFINWQKFEHTQLGLVEIGGWDYKNVWQNAPSAYLSDICKKQCDFVIAHILMSPRLAIFSTEIIAYGDNIYKLIFKLENQGFLPTYTNKKALERKMVKPIEVSISLPENTKLISGKIKQEIDHLEGRSNKYFTSLSQQGEDYRKTIEWMIQGELGTEIIIKAVAERSGTVETKVILSEEK